MFKVGEWDVDLLELARVALPTSTYVDVGEGEEDATVEIAMNALLLRRAGRTVLVDTGIGVTADALGLPATDLLGALGARGVGRDDVDLVCLTHLDSDHIGGALEGTWPDDVRPAFPDAEVVVPEAEVAWAIAGGSGASFEGGAAVVTALRPQLRTVTDGTELAPGILVRDAPGHTPGQMVVEIAGDPPLLYLADVVHAPFLLGRPGQEVKQDRDPATAVATRDALLREAARRGLDVLATHVPSSGPGRVERVAGAFRWVGADA